MKLQTSTEIGQYQVSFSPTSVQLDDIEEWLIAEEKKSDEGFYCNWSVIKSFFDKNQLVVISKGDSTLGFATWWLPTEKTAHIDIMEVKPRFRKKGIGRQLTRELLDFLKKKGVYVVDLQCSPASSEKAWKKLGFIAFPNQENYNFNNGVDKRLYIVLKETLEPSSALLTSETIELWNDEPYMTDELTPPTYMWNVEFIKGTRHLTKPIIHPAYHDWRVRRKVNGQIVKDDKVKYFGVDIDFGSFIVIEELS